jgi:hypothetical protein
VPEAFLETTYLWNFGGLHVNAGYQHKWPLTIACGVAYNAQASEYGVDA